MSKRKFERIVGSKWTVSLLAGMLALVMAGANPFAEQTVAPLDLLFRHAGWQSIEVEPPPWSVFNRERSDILDALLPTWTDARNLIREGNFPSWLHSARGSSIGVQLPVLGMLTPSFGLFALAPTPGLGLYLSALFKLLVAGVGMYLLMRLYLGRFGAAIAAVSFAACGFNTSWFFWPQVATSIWLPWLFWATASWDRTGNPGFLGVLAASVAMLILGGFPSVAAFCLYAWALWAAWLLLARLRTMRSVGSFTGSGFKLAAAVGIGFLVCAYPLYELMAFMEPLSLDERSRHAKANLGWSDLRYLLSPLELDSRGIIRNRYAMYVGLAGPVLAVLAAFWMLLTRRWKSEVLFFLLLTVLSAAICFGALNGSWLTLAPVFDFNPWNRWLLIFDFALAALAGIGANYLYQGSAAISRSRVVLPTLALLALSLHTWDMTRYFQAFNPAVPQSWYYPQSPVLKHVQNNLKPGQSVVADLSYMVGGTLGAYGIPEWFAHRHHSPAEVKLMRQLVKDPFATKTAARFPAGRIKVDSPYFRELGVRYLLVSQALSTGPKVETANRRVAIGAGEQLSQPVWISATQTLSTLRFSSHQRNQSGLHAALYDRAGKELFAGPVLRERNLLAFEFGAAGLTLNKGMHRVVLTNNGGAPVTLLAKKETRPKHQMQLHGLTQASSLVYQLGAARWRLALKDRSQYLYESVDPVGPYVVNDNALVAVAADVPEPGLIRVQVPENLSGNFVWPARLGRSWQAFVDGQVTPIEYRHDVLHSVPVSSGLQLELRYPTGRAIMGLASTLFGLLLCMAWFVWWSGKSRSRG